MNPVSKPATETVEKCWRGSAPAWVLRLAAFCDRESQAAAANKIGRSPALVNMVLKNRYTGDMDAVEKRVETAFTETIECPVLGDIDGQTCLNWQSKPYSGANHHVVRMFRACQRCPNNQLCKKD
jgi:hypothetical protein